MHFKGCGVAIHLCKQCGRVLPFLFKSSRQDSVERCWGIEPTKRKWQVGNISISFCSAIQSQCACPLFVYAEIVVKLPICRLPKHLHLGLSRHVLQKVSVLGIMKALFCVTVVLVRRSKMKRMPFWCVETQTFVLYKLRKFAYYLLISQRISNDLSVEQPYLQQQVSAQVVYDFLLQQNNKLFSFVSFVIVDWRGPVTSRSAEQSGWRWSPRLSFNLVITYNFPSESCLTFAA